MYQGAGPVSYSSRADTTQEARHRSRRRSELDLWLPRSSAVGCAESSEVGIDTILPPEGLTGLFHHFHEESFSCFGAMRFRTCCSFSDGGDAPILIAPPSERREIWEIKGGLSPKSPKTGLQFSKVQTELFTRRHPAQLLTPLEPQSRFGDKVLGI